MDSKKGSPFKGKDLLSSSAGSSSLPHVQFSPGGVLSVSLLPLAGILKAFIVLLRLWAPVWRRPSPCPWQERRATKEP